MVAKSRPRPFYTAVHTAIPYLDNAIAQRRLESAQHARICSTRMSSAIKGLATT